MTAAGHTNNGVLTHLNLVLPLSLNGNNEGPALGQATVLCTGWSDLVGDVLSI